MKTLFISDLDGTLLNNNAVLSDKSAEIINSLLEKGMLFSVATARSIVTVAPILSKLNLNLPAILMNGVFLCDVKLNEFLTFHALEKKTTTQLIEAFEKNGRPPFVFSFNDNEIAVQYKQLYNKVDNEFYEDRKKRYKSFKQVDEFDLSGNIVYVNAVDKKEIIEPISKELSKIDGIKFVMYEDSYSDYWFLECFSSNASKTIGAKKVKELTGADRIVAFGDNFNDIELLKNADVAVAVSNAHEEVKEIADIIIDSNDNDGVAKYLLENY